MEGIIIKNESNNYTVRTNKGINICKPRGKFRLDKITPLVGDKVIKAKFENGELVFDAVYEKIEEEIPATGDINVKLLISLSILCIIVCIKKLNLQLHK